MPSHAKESKRVTFRTFKCITQGYDVKWCEIRIYQISQFKLNGLQTLEMCLRAFLRFALSSDLLSLDVDEDSKILILHHLATQYCSILMSSPVSTCQPTAVAAQVQQLPPAVQSCRRLGNICSWMLSICCIFTHEMICVVLARFVLSAIYVQESEDLHKWATIPLVDIGGHSRYVWLYVLFAWVLQGCDRSPFVNGLAASSCSQMLAKCEFEINVLLSLWLGREASRARPETMTMQRMAFYFGRFRSCIVLVCLGPIAKHILPN